MPDRREVARGRQRHADDPALGRRVGDLADLAVVRGDRRGVDADAALALGVGLVAEHRRGGEPQHVERADQVHVDDGLERVEAVRPALASRALRPADPRAADRDPQLARGLRRPRRPRRRRSRRTATNRRRARPASARPCSAFRSAIVTRAPPAASRRAVAAPSPEAPPATSASAPSIRMGADPNAPLGLA